MQWALHRSLAPARGALGSDNFLTIELEAGDKLGEKRAHYREASWFTNVDLLLQEEGLVSRLHLSDSFLLLDFLALTKEEWRDDDAALIHPSFECLITLDFMLLKFVSMQIPRGEGRDLRSCPWVFTALLFLDCPPLCLHSYGEFLSVDINKDRLSNSVSLVPSLGLASVAHFRTMRSDSIDPRVQSVFLQPGLNGIISCSGFGREPPDWPDISRDANALQFPGLMLSIEMKQATPGSTLTYTYIHTRRRSGE